MQGTHPALDVQRCRGHRSLSGHGVTRIRLHRRAGLLRSDQVPAEHDVPSQQRRRLGRRRDRVRSTLHARGGEPRHHHGLGGAVEADVRRRGGPCRVAAWHEADLALRRVWKRCLGEMLCRVLGGLRCGCSVAWTHLGVAVRLMRHPVRCSMHRGGLNGGAMRTQQHRRGACEQAGDQHEDEGTESKHRRR